LGEGEYTDQHFNFNESRDLLRRQALGQFWTEIAGLGIFDVESGMDTHSGGLWCLPVNPQFGLLSVLNGAFLLEEYRWVGVVKLSLS
jgi:hypothetical protein